MAKSPDKRAFVKLIQKELRIINSLACIYYQRNSDREDCRQDVILQLWKAYPSFEGRSSVTTWIYSVALRTILKKKRGERISINTESLQLDKSAISAASYADDDLQLLYTLIDDLSSSDRALVILYLEGYKQREMAGMLGMTVSNISTKLGRIKTKLKNNSKIKWHEPRRS